MLLWIVLAVAFVYLDQITKYLAVIFLKGGDSFPFIKGVFHFTYVENRGAAFGILKDQRWVFMVISSLAIVALSIYFYKHRMESKLQNTAITMMIAGGIGNMIDRVALGYVVDFLDFTLIKFAVFNVADSFVCVGVGLFVLYLILTMVKDEKATRAEKNAAESKDEQS